MGLQLPFTSPLFWPMVASSNDKNLLWLWYKYNSCFLKYKLVQLNLCKIFISRNRSLVYFPSFANFIYHLSINGVSEFISITCIIIIVQFIYWYYYHISLPTGSGWRWTRWWWKHVYQTREGEKKNTRMWYFGNCVTIKCREDHCS